MLKEFIENVLEFVNNFFDFEEYIRRTRKEDGTKYYKKLLVYLDHIFVVSHNPKKVIIDIGKVFEIKNDN